MEPKLSHPMTLDEARVAFEEPDTVIDCERLRFVKLSDGSIYQNCNDLCCADYFENFEEWLTYYGHRLSEMRRVKL